MSGVVPLSRKVSLQELFEIGWSPEPRQCGMHQLVETAVVWLKSVSLRCQSTEVNVPPPMKQLLSTFADLTKSTHKLETTKKDNAKILATARATVEQRMQDVMTKAKGNSQQDPEVAKKKHMLETWMLGREEETKKTEGYAQAEHNKIRDMFNDMIQDAIHRAYWDWHAEVAHAATQPFDEVDFMKDLELEFERSMKLNSPETKPEVTMQPEVRPETTPEAPVPTQVQPDGRPDTTDQDQPEGKSEATAVVQPAQESNAGDQGQEAGPAKRVRHQLIVPKGSDVPVVHKKVNIFDPAVQKTLNWSGQGEGQPQPPVVAPGDVPTARVDTVQKEFKRQDTSDLQKAAADKDTVLMDGVKYFKKPNGGLETEEQRDHRLGKNRYMVFSRSLQGLFDQLGFLFFHKPWFSFLSHTYPHHYPV